MSLVLDFITASGVLAILYLQTRKRKMPAIERLELDADIAATVMDQATDKLHSLADAGDDCAAIADRLDAVSTKLAASSTSLLDALGRFEGGSGPEDPETPEEPEAETGDE